jgi:hypothetical protein
MPQPPRCSSATPREPLHSTRLRLSRWGTSTRLCPPARCLFWHTAVASLPSRWCPPCRVGTRCWSLSLATCLLPKSGAARRRAAVPMRSRPRPASSFSTSGRRAPLACSGRSRRALPRPTSSPHALADASSPC